MAIITRRRRTRQYGTVSWKANFEAGTAGAVLGTEELQQIHCTNADAFWDEGVSAATYDTTYARAGSKSAKLTVHGPTSSGSGIRAELSLLHTLAQGNVGETHYYSLSTYFPSTPNSASGWDGADWNVICQWSPVEFATAGQGANLSPPFSLSVVHIGGVVHLAINVNDQNFDAATHNGIVDAQYGVVHNLDLGLLIYDQWDDFTFKVTFGIDSASGSVTGWRNGKQMFAATPTRTSFSTEGNYWELDVYRRNPGTANVNTVHFDRVMVHSAYVAPGGGSAQQTRPFYGNILWHGDFETGDISQWSGWPNAQLAGDSTVTIQTSRVAQGTYAALFAITGGGTGTNVRAQLLASQADTGGYHGQSWYYSWSMYLPSNPDATTGWDPNWNIVLQWAPENLASYTDCGPPVELGLLPVAGVPHLHVTRNDQPFYGTSCGAYPGTEGDWDLGAIPYDQWVAVTVHIKFGDATNGFFAAWVNGVQVMAQTAMRTEYGSVGSIMANDIYRPDFTAGAQCIIYYDGMIRHDAYTP